MLNTIGEFVGAYLCVKEHVDFVEQKQEAGEGEGKPDVTVKLPGNRVVYIDSKVPWANYQAMVTTDDAGQRADYLKKFSAHNDAVAAIANKLGASLRRVTTDQPLESVLFDFLRERMARGKKIRRAESR